MRKRRIVCIILCLCILLSAALAVVLCTQKGAHEPIVILYENDVHCAVDGYSKLLALKNELSESYKYVGVVSSGDFVQGGTLGAVSKGEYIGKLTITEDGLDTELVETAAYEKTDAGIDAYITQINESYAELGNRVIGQSSVALNDYDGDTRLVRDSETALGNFCSDALRLTTGAEISYVNGGGLRAPIEAGEVTFNDLYSVFPYNNQVVTVEVTGQMLLDMLELSVLLYPEEDGSFPSMSGVTFCMNTQIPSAVQLDENGFFTGVDGERRIYDVRILDKESGEYRDLILDETYILAGFGYHLLDLGGGMSMFEDAVLIDAEGTLDVDLLENYIADHLGGVIGEEYAEPQGRITFTEGR